MKSAVTTLILGLALLLVAGGCGNSDDSAHSAQAAPATGQPNAAGTEYVAPDAKGVQTIQVKSTAIPEYLELPAHIEADPTLVVHVFTPAGGRITEMKVRPWDRVEKGQTLAVLDSSELARAVADYHKALVDNEVKQKQMARAQDLLEHHAIAERDYQQAQGDAQMAQAELEAAREAIRVFGMDPDHAKTELRVVAPRSGVVLDVGAAPGEFSKSLDAPLPLCTVADISTVWALGDIYEKDLRDVKSGQEADVALNAYPDQHWTGRVSVVSDAVDPTTRTLRVRVVLPNPRGQLKPAMFGRVRILRSSSQGILVPAAAVIREGNDAYIFVAKGNGKYERRSVKLGRSTETSLEISSGVTPGETVVSEGALLLRASGQS
jgi:membrane fusion protein, heavy metal efflux system